MSGSQYRQPPLFLIVCVCSMIFILLGYLLCRTTSTQEDYEPAISAKVVEILSEEEEPVMDEYVATRILFTAKLTSGEQDGEEVEVEQYIDPMYLPTPDAVEKGDKVLVMESQEVSGAKWVYAGVNRIPSMTWMIIWFLLMILAIGGVRKGGATIVSLLFSMGAIFLVYIPAILKGYNIYFFTIVVAVFIILSSLLLLNGWSTKTMCAVVGNVGGTLVAGLLALWVNQSLSITGVVDQDYAFLTMLESGVSLNLKAVVWGGILIGSLGAVMDVSMTIASAMQEIVGEMQRKTIPKLVYSGFQVGRDAIGTMTNTLILAYVGGSLAVVLLFAAYNKNMMIVMNLEMIVVEVIHAVVGSMGILLAVPLTVFFSAWAYLRNEPTPPPKAKPTKVPEAKTTKQTKTK